MICEQHKISTPRFRQSRHTYASQRAPVPEGHSCHRASALREKLLRRRPCTEQCQPIALTQCLELNVLSKMLTACLCHILEVPRSPHLDKPLRVSRLSLPFHNISARSSTLAQIPSTLMRNIIFCYIILYSGNKPRGPQGFVPKRLGFPS